jgi:hypothetical protein
MATQKMYNGRSGMIFPPDTAIPDEGESVGDKKPGYAAMTLTEKFAAWWTKKQWKIWNDQVLKEVSYYREINTVYLLTEFNTRFMRLVRDRLRLMLLYLPRRLPAMCETPKVTWPGLLERSRWMEGLSPILDTSSSHP